MQDKIISKKQARKFLRYLLMFSAVFIASQYAPECQISTATSFIMGTIAAVVFVIIDLYFPIPCPTQN
jgi:hypothetical protein